MDKALRKSIIQTLSFFSLFKLPLTAVELHQRLFGFGKISYSHFLNYLKKTRDSGMISAQFGYYFLPGQQQTVQQRRRAVRVGRQKIKIAGRAVKKIRYLPYVKGVYVCNSVAMGVAVEESDVDLFIVVKPGRIWLTRAIIIFTMKIFRLRPGNDGGRDKICLSFFVDHNSLDFRKISIEDPDIYLIYWLEHLIPLYDPYNLRKDVIDANRWIKKYLHNSLSEFVYAGKYGVNDNVFSRWSKAIAQKLWSGRYGDMLEARAKVLQLAKIDNNPRLVGNRDGISVVIEDHMLKFHDNDRRRYFKKEWILACSKITV